MARTYKSRDRRDATGVRVPRKMLSTALAVSTVAAFALVGLGFQAAGATTTAALYAWGDNANGQIGNGTTTNALTPTQVPLPAGVNAVAGTTGNGHSVAIGSDNHLYTWGFNADGELGNGTTTNTTSPGAVNLPGGVTATAVSAGQFHNLAIGSDGFPYAWGYNGFGQVGDGTTTNALSPEKIGLAANVRATAIAAGSYFSLAIGNNGFIYSWGDGQFGELGNNSTLNHSNQVKPAMPTGVSGVAIAAGANHGLAIGSDGNLYAWGHNANGQLGNNSTNDSLKPIVVSMPTGVTATAIAAGGNHSAGGQPQDGVGTSRQ